MTQSAFAAKLSFFARTDINQSYVSHIEHYCAATLDRIMVIASVLELPPSACVVAAETALLFSQLDDAKTSDMLTDLLENIYGVLHSKRWMTEDEQKAVKTWLDAATNENKNLLAEAIGAAIQSFRIRQGYSQLRLTELIREKFPHDTAITSSSLSQTECAHAPPSWTRLGQIAAVLGVSLGDLFVQAEYESVRFDVPLPEQLKKLSDLSAKASALQQAPLTAEACRVFAELNLQMQSVRRQIGIYTRNFAEW